MVPQPQANRTPVPGRYQVEGGTYQLAKDGKWHRVYVKTTGQVSTMVTSARHPAILAILADPAAAAVRAGRCPRCQTPCGSDHGADDCRSAKLGVAS